MVKGDCIIRNRELTGFLKLEENVKEMQTLF